MNLCRKQPTVLFHFRNKVTSLTVDGNLCFPTRHGQFQTGTGEGTKELHMDLKADEMICPTCKLGLKLFQTYHVYKNIYSDYVFFLNEKEALIGPI